MKVFKINKFDFYMAPTLEEAITQAMADSGLSRDEAINEPRECTAEELQRLVYGDDDGNGRTFQEELDRRLAACARTEMFASLNW
jgi:hypothetical protein